MEPNFILGEGGPLMEYNIRPNLSTSHINLNDYLFNSKSNPNLDALYNGRETDIGKAVNDKLGKVGKAGKGLGYVAKEWLPITSDLYDIGRGGYNLFHGRPGLGLSQIGMGAVGLVPAGKLAKYAGKGLKATLKGQKKIDSAIRGIKKANVPGSVALAGYDYATRNNGQPIPEDIASQLGTEEMEPITDKNDLAILNSDGNGEQLNTNLPTGDFNPNRQHPFVPPEREMILGPTDNQIDINKKYSPLNEYLDKLTSANKPNVDALQGYLDNYNNNLNNDIDIARFYTAYSGLSGNNGYRELIDRLSPMKNEANRVALQQQLNNAKTNNLATAGNIIGKSALMKKMGLPEEVALADKDSLKAYTDLMGDTLGLKGDMYKADLGYNTAVYKTNVENAVKKMIEDNKITAEQGIALLKARGYNLDSAIEALALGNTTAEDLSSIINMMGNPTGLDMRGLPVKNTEQSIYSKYGVN